MLITSVQIFLGQPQPWPPVGLSLWTFFRQPLLRSTWPCHLSQQLRSTFASSSRWILSRRSCELTRSLVVTPHIQQIIDLSLLADNATACQQCSLVVVESSQSLFLEPSWPGLAIWGLDEFLAQGQHPCPCREIMILLPFSRDFTEMDDNLNKITDLMSPFNSRCFQRFSYDQGWTCLALSSRHNCSASLQTGFSPWTSSFSCHIRLARRKMSGLPCEGSLGPFV